MNTLPHELITIILYKAHNEHMKKMTSLLIDCVIPWLFRSRLYGEDDDSHTECGNMFDKSEPKGVYLSSFTLTALKRVNKELYIDITKGDDDETYNAHRYLVVKGLDVDT